jgi:hypothetical protein
MTSLLEPASILPTLNATVPLVPVDGRRARFALTGVEALVQSRQKRGSRLLYPRRTP